MRLGYKLLNIVASETMRNCAGRPLSRHRAGLHRNWRTDTDASAR